MVRSWGRGWVGVGGGGRLCVCGGVGGGWKGEGAEGRMRVQFLVFMVKPRSKHKNVQMNAYLF